MTTVAAKERGIVFTAESVRPGAGWRHQGGAVWGHDSGIGIHVYGLCRTADGRIIVGTQWPESRALDRMIAVNGGNRRRGVMAWALRLGDA